MPDFSLSGEIKQANVQGITGTVFLFLTEAL
jgi:hypothetical protein